MEFLYGNTRRESLVTTSMYHEAQFSIKLKAGDENQGVVRL